MKSNYRRIGDFIELVDVRNEDLAVDTLLGLSISKQFIPSVANTVGTNMKKYKIIKKNQFACSIMQVRRDKKMPVAILKDFEEAIISQAYPVFEVIDETELLPDYLMMWFSRSEFDRQATFWAVGGVRGSLEWDDFLNFELPIPPIEEQQAIVTEYQTVTNRIQLNEQINIKLEETAQALYRHWFVDFEFPDENGKSYKSSGGKMVYNEELEKEVPEGWEINNLSSLIVIQNGYAFKSEQFANDGLIPIIKIKNVTPPYSNTNGSMFYSEQYDKSLVKYIVTNDDLLISMTGSGANQPNSAVGQVSRFVSDVDGLLNQRVGNIKTNSPNYKNLVYYFLESDSSQAELLSNSTGSANQANISPTIIGDLKIVLPQREEIVIEFEEQTKKIRSHIKQNFKLNNILEKKELILLSKMAGKPSAFNVSTL